MPRIETGPTDKNEFTTGDRIRLARIGVGLKVAEVAARMGIKPISIYGKENGNDMMTAKFMTRYESALGIKEGTLMTDECSIDGSESIQSIEMNKPQRTILSRDRIAVELKRRIVAGEYKDRLPTSGDLARELGFSRPSIQYALNQLTEAGIIAGKKKKGTIILRDVRPDELPLPQG